MYIISALVCEKQSFAVLLQYFVAVQLILVGCRRLQDCDLPELANIINRPRGRTVQYHCYHNMYCTTEAVVKTSKKIHNRENPPGVEWISFSTNKTARENILKEIKSKSYW